jgi:hypothetical protein
MRTLGWKVKGKFVFRRGFKTVVPDSESSSWLALEFVYVFLSHNYPRITIKVVEASLCIKFSYQPLDPISFSLTIFHHWGVKPIWMV